MPLRGDQRPMITRFEQPEFWPGGTPFLDLCSVRADQYLYELGIKCWYAFDKCLEHRCKRSSACDRDVNDLDDRSAQRGLRH